MTTEPSYRPFIPTTSAVTQLIRLEQNLADHGGEPDETHRRLRLWTPKGKFSLFLRIYQPKPAFSTGEWKLPSVLPTN